MTTSQISRNIHLFLNRLPSRKTPTQHRSCFYIKDSLTLANRATTLWWWRGFQPWILTYSASVDDGWCYYRVILYPSLLIKHLIVQDKREESRLVVLFLPQSLQFFIPLGLLFRFFDKVANGIAFEHFLWIEDLVKVFLQLFSPFFNIFGTFIGDSEDLFLGKWRSIWEIVYKFLMLLSSRASWTFLN